MARRGGLGPAFGCVLTLGGVAFIACRFGPQLLALVRPGSAPLVEWGMAHEADGLELRLVDAAIETTQVEDAVGARAGAADLHLTLEVANTGVEPVTYRTPRLLRAAEPKLVDEKGKDVPRAT